MNKSELIEYLKRYGKSENTLKNSSLDELEAMYGQIVKENLQERKTILGSLIGSANKEQDELSMEDERAVYMGRELYDRIVDAIKDEKLEVYDVIEEMIVTLNRKEIDDVLESLGQERWYGEFYMMYRMKLREVEEWYISQIEEFVKSLNEEEKYIILSEVKRKRRDMDYIKSLNKMLSDKNEREKFINISGFRYMMVCDYLQESEEEYEAFYEEHIHKQEIVKKILEITKNYKHEELEKKSTSDLKHIYEHYLREREEARKVRQNLNKFIAMLRQCISEGSDEKTMNKIVGSMFVELDSKSIEKIVGIIYDVSPSVGERIRSSYNESYAKKKQ